MVAKVRRMKFTPHVAKAVVEAVIARPVVVGPKA
jgi:hypothetical protein